ncbi:uncharacterized protein LOC120350555 isoform X2 [Nilaparvata lugens]|uniref:uncharacterized protein LOC120350555 isoform X2 n=1 Tax=Nilaparvata lugens TaxID=108931 RepID=UPI00193CD8F0|nr:uncharacterized protein LOC120350555 isoform X2 [Nilaparvata lugens]
MPPKGKRNSLLTVRSGIIKNLSWLYTEYFNFKINDENDFQKLLAVKTKLLNFEQRYEEISLEFDSDDIDDNEHQIVTEKFLMLIANVNTILKNYDSQQQVATFQAPAMEHQSPNSSPVPKSPGSVDHDSVINTNQSPSASVTANNVNSLPLQPTMPIYQGLQLPMVPLPEFSGSFDSWLEFCDTFSNMVIENQTLAPATKLYYLRKALSGEALAHIQNIPPGNGNFELAWNLLTQRYNNPRLIASTHIQGIESPPALKKNCSKSLRAFIDHCKCHINALEALKLDVQIKDLLYMQKITSQLDSNILREWEKRIEINEIPTMDKLWEFLENQCKVMDAISSHSPSNPPTNQKVFTQATSNAPNVRQNTRPFAQNNTLNNFQPSVSCQFCNDRSHGIFKCVNFSKIPINQRYDAIKRKGLCFNCLNPYTDNHNCSSKRCQKCDKRHHTVLHDSFTSNSGAEVSNQLETFWKLEEVSSVIPVSPECARVEAHYKENTIRHEDGRFQVSLPRKDSFATLGHSRTQAMKRFHSLEKRFLKEPELKPQYVEFMQEYEDLGHMHPVPPPAPEEQVYYIPHHAVFKPDSTTTKTRVVFDASAKTSTGISLNDVIFKGPVVQSDLFDIVLRFRMRPFAFIADITKMYRQILLDPSDRNLHRIFWRDDTSKPLQEYQLATVTYGTACASYLSTRTLNLLAELESTPDSPLYHSIHQEFYVDDLISGASTLEQAMELSHQLLTTLNKGCFELRKWMSNSPELLNSLPSNLLETSIVKPISDPDNGITKALGLLWNSNSDSLSICSNIDKISEKTSFTKREFLSVIASTFDPLGIISPIIILPKILFQNLWLAKIDWDDSLPNDMLLKWLQIIQELSKISSISIPRCVVSKDQCSIVELHGFSDSSATAYGACVYVRTIQNNVVQTHLLCGKSRVAPLKPVSIPNLELCGALVLSRLINKVVSALNSLDLTISGVFLWSDSQIVCKWLQSPPDRKSIFVSLRVGEIQESTSQYVWNYVKSSHNPADLISRGMIPSELANNKLWWHGPPWLADPTDSWRSFSSHVAILAPNTVLVNTAVVSPLSIISERVSNSFKIIRVTAYVLRFLHNIRQKVADRRTDALSVDEIEDAEIHLLKAIQAEAFHKELEILRANDELNASSKFHSLSLFIHSDGLIRVGGRLANANIDFDFKHQILLPANHKFTKALIFYHHNKLCHAGVQATMAAIRQRFWIPSTRRTVKNVLRKCIKCFRFTHTQAAQLMGQLPSVHVNIDFPFMNVGLDYAGPFSLRIGGPKSRTFGKAYFAFFICKITRAVHIEVVSELSTSVFLAALTRFISRRGIPRNIYSDNATTFVGANNDLKELGDFLNLPSNQQILQNSAASLHIQWNFIPPRAPHHGGLWERGIRNFKSIYKIIAFKHIWNFEEMCTLSAQVEAILNSSPIVPLSEDPLDLQFLSPGHFLIARPLNALPSHKQKFKHVNFLARWNRLAEVTKEFWQQWSEEYLVTLQKRHKWSSSSPNLQVGTLVLLKDPGTPPTLWKLGRITEVFPGSDDKVRVIQVLTDSGVFKRSIASVAPLPLDDSE